MSTPEYSELVAAVRREGEGIVAAAGLGLDPEVPTCAGWDVAKLVRHVSRIYAYVTVVVTSRATSDPERQPTPDGDPVDVLNDLLDELVAALSDMDEDTPVWNWSDDAADFGMFWSRRMAHESSIHRYDAQTAHNMVQPIEAELAADGLDELLDVMGPRACRRPGVVAPTGTILLQSSDNASWSLRLGPEGLTRMEATNEPDVTVHATASSLLLASYNRVPWPVLETTGDADLLTAWTTAMQI